MAVTTIETQRFKDLLGRVGKTVVNALYPNEFEYYAITLELVDSAGDTIDHLTFPINPDSIVYDDKSLVNIIQTASGVTALDTNIFIPKTINLSGTFGKDFKLLIRNPIVKEQKSTNTGFSNVEFDEDVVSGGELKESTTKPAIRTFSNNLKRGYGVIKVLERILNISRGLDSYNKPYNLNLYNPALGHFFVVKYLNMKLQQDHKSSNMIWYYNLNLSCINKLSGANNRELNKSKSLIYNLKNVAQSSGTKELRIINQTIF